MSDSVQPIDGKHQAPPSPGFFRQEHWSGLPFPSPVQESEKWKGSRSVVSDSLQPHGLQPTRLLRPWDFPGKSAGVGWWAMQYRATQNRWVLVESSEKTWFTREGSSKPLKHSCLENPMNSMNSVKREKKGLNICFSLLCSAVAFEP